MAQIHPHHLHLRHSLVMLPIFDHFDHSGRHRIPHHPKSEKLVRQLVEVDFHQYGDYFCWKVGGDGDNGETLMYELDEIFEKEPSIFQVLVFTPEDEQGHNKVENAWLVEALSEENAEEILKERNKAGEKPIIPDGYSIRAFPLDFDHKCLQLY